ncbi:hypothetical protein [Alicyclobacillus fodiniaquatilis]|jgi:hypothetical protein|uniref:Uncharacterized protein n=1 Tax=Alicyclobacillus fodiniaquatilis TaxID=1661150 RepID=A0ABW4JKU9_9BACL
MNVDPSFETVIFTQVDGVQNALMLKELRAAVERQEIRIVDIKRNRDQLVVIFRRLLS